MSSPAPRVGALVGVLVLCLGAFALAGCYTTLRHPVSADLSTEYDYNETNCYDCHDEAAFYHSYYGVYFDYYYDSPWFGYYSDPWWYDSYWGDGGDRSAPPLSREERHHWRRGAPSGGPRGSSGYSTAPYLRKDYMKSSKPGQPQKPADKPKKKTSGKKRHTGRRGKKK